MNVFIYFHKLNQCFPVYLSPAWEIPLRSWASTISAPDQQNEMSNVRLFI